jgi:hypothetical protein
MIRLPSPERLHREGTWSAIDFHWKVQPENM